MTPGERPASSTPYIKAMDDLRFSEDQLNDIIDSTEAQWKSQAQGRSSDKASPQNRQLRSTGHQREQRTPLRLSRRATIGLAAIGIASIGSAGLAIGSNVSGVSFSELLGKWLEAGSAVNDNKDRASGSADGAETTELINMLGTYIGASDTAGGFTLTMERILGDQNFLAIAFALSREDGGPLTEFVNPQTGKPAICLSPYAEGSQSSTLLFFDSVSSSMGDWCFDYSGNLDIIRFIRLFSTFEPVIGQPRTLRVQEVMTYSAPETNSPPIHRSTDGEEVETRVIAEGPWNIEFTASYEDLSIDYLVNDPVTIDAYETTATDLFVSPLGVAILFEPYPEPPYPVDEQLYAAWQSEKIVVSFKDSTRLELESGEIGGIERPGRRASFNPLVNPRDIASVEFAGVVFEAPES